MKKGTPQEIVLEKIGTQMHKLSQTDDYDEAAGFDRVIIVLCEVLRELGTAIATEDRVSIKESLIEMRTALANAKNVVAGCGHEPVEPPDEFNQTVEFFTD